MHITKYRPLLVIVGVAALLCVGAIVFSFQIQAAAAQHFPHDGYLVSVVAQESAATVEQASADEANADTGTGNDAAGSGSVRPAVSLLEFSADAEYRTRYPDRVVFSDTQGNQESVDQASFVHYTDGSISSFSRGVFLDLNNIDPELICYYDLPENKLLQHVGDSYLFENNSAQLSMTDMLWKIDETKYLVVSSDIQFDAGGETIHRFQGSGSYLEVSYIDSGVVLFANEEGAYQTVAEDSAVTLANGVTIDFGDMIATDADGTVVSLAQMVIGADDNIEVAPDSQKDALVEDEAEEEGSEGTEGAEGEGAGSGVSGGSAGSGGETIIGGGGSGGGSGSSSSSSGAVAGSGEPDVPANPGDAGDAGGSGDAGDPGKDTGDDADPSAALPLFSVNGGSTSPVGFSTTVNIVDNENLLTSGAHVVIVEAATGKVVYESSVAQGVLNFDVNTSNLKPGTEYVMSVDATYYDGKKEYTKTFLDKVFTTDTVGISIEKDFFTSESLALFVSVGSYSNIAAADIRLLDPEGSVVETRSVDIGQARSEAHDSIQFGNLKSNTAYEVELCNVSYSSITVDSFGDPLECKTLKKTPQFGNPKVSIDRKAMSFNFDLESVTDPDAGIVGYTWEIFRADQYTVNANGEQELGNPVKTVSPSSGRAASVSVDNNTIVQGVSYIARAKAQFEDNEKTVEFDTPFCEHFSIDGVSFPSLRFEIDKDDQGNQMLTYESIQAVIYIDNAFAIKEVNAADPLVVTWTNSLGVMKQDVVTSVNRANDGIALPFVKNNLRANDVYTVSVYALVDLNDRNVASRVFIGNVQFKTPEPNTLSVVNPSETPAVSTSFAVPIQFEPQGGEGSIELEMKTMEQLSISLYKGTEVSSGTPLATKLYVGGNSEADPYSSELYASFFQNATTVTPTTFGISTSDLEANTYYTIVVGPAQDYTQFPNNLPIDNSTTRIAVKTSNTYPDLPTDPTTGVLVTEIQNYQASVYGGQADPSLANETVVGYRITANFPNANKIAKRVTYYIRDARTNEVLDTVGMPIDASTNNQVPSYTFFFKDKAAGKPEIGRGRDYRFSYEMEINLTGNAGDNLMYPECTGKGVTLTSKDMKAPLQAASLSLYPKISSGTKVTWAYQASDPDHALENSDAKFQSNSKAGEAFTDRGGIVAGADWKTVDITAANNQVYTLKMRQNLYSKYFGTGAAQGTDVRETVLVQSYFEQAVTLAANNFTPSVKTDTETNQLKVTLTAPSSYTVAMLDNVAALKISCKDTNAAGTAPLEFVRAPILDTVNRSLSASVSLSEMKSLLRKDFDVTVSLVYDNNTYGFDAKAGSFAIQSMGGSAGETVYQKASGANLAPLTAAGGSYYTANAAEPLNTLTYTDAITRATGMLKIQATQHGAALCNASGIPLSTYLCLKSLVTTSDATPAQGARFDIITPVVGVNVGSVELDRANVALTLEGLDDVEIQNQSVIITLKRKVSDTEYETVGTYEYPYGAVAGGTATKNIVLPQNADSAPLLSDSTYTFTVEANIRAWGSSGSYKLVNLNDAVLGSSRSYSFTTAKDVHVDVQNVAYKADSYENKRIEIAYTLDRSIGFDLEYELYRSDAEGNPVGDRIPIEWPTGLYSSNNLTTLAYGPGSDVARLMPLGETYVVVIKAHPKNSTQSTAVLGSDSFVFHLDDLRKPLASIIATPNLVEYQEETPVPVVPADEGGTGGEPEGGAGPDAGGTSGGDAGPVAAETVSVTSRYYTLDYKVSILDVYGSVVNDTYMVRFYSVDGSGAKTQIATDYDNQVFSTKTYNQIFRFGSKSAPLGASSQYLLEVYGVMDPKNVGGMQDISHGGVGETNCLVASAYATTVNETGIDVGFVQVRPVDAVGSQFRLEYFNSVNISAIDTIQYTVYSGSGFVDGKTQQFSSGLVSHQYSEGTYYSFTPEVTLQTTGLYNIQVNYYRHDPATGAQQIVASDTYSYSYINESESQASSPMAQLFSLFVGGE